MQVHMELLKKKKKEQHAGTGLLWRDHKPLSFPAGENHAKRRGLSSCKILTDHGEYISICFHAPDNCVLGKQTKKMKKISKIQILSHSLLASNHFM